MADLYDRYSGIVYSVALRVLGDTGAAEDVMQEIFIQLWRDPKRFDGNRGSLGAWLAVVTRHRAIDVLRRRRPETDLEGVVVSVDARLDDAVERSAFATRVRKIVGGLSQEQQKALQLAFFEGMTHTEIAAKTGEPLGTIKTRIRSALIALRKALNAEMTA